MYHFDWIKRHAERTPNKLALVDAFTGQQWTYAEFNGRSNCLASFLKDELGIRRGDRVSILAQNSADYFVALFACSKIGAILNTLNWRLAVPELAYILNVLPTFHAGGLGLYAGPIFHAGGTLISMRAFDPGQLLQLIETWQVSAMLLVPAIYLALSQFPDFDQHDLSGVRHWGSGGSSLPPSLVHEFAEKDIIIQQGFGMTETGPTVFIIDKENAVGKAGSVGKPVLHTDVSIRDREGNVLGPGEVGELCIRGGNVTSGYWNRPEATAEALKDGWLHSGDAAKYDEEGFFYIVDRWKDMFISGGENVYPAEVENVIYQHPAVAEVAVIGVPHPKWQETGRALVVLKAKQTAAEAEIIAFCQGKLARYKIPKSVLFMDQPLPRTAAGKVLKRELRETHGDPIGG